jgi:hypothetical protein
MVERHRDAASRTQASRETAKRSGVTKTDRRPTHRRGWTPAKRRSIQPFPAAFRDKLLDALRASEPHEAVLLHARRIAKSRHWGTALRGGVKRAARRARRIGCADISLARRRRGTRVDLPELAGGCNRERHEADVVLPERRLGSTRRLAQRRESHAGRDRDRSVNRS